MQASQRQAAQATEPDQQLASQKRIKQEQQQTISKVIQLLYMRFSYSIAV
jgi:hypothetical protein